VFLDPRTRRVFLFTAVVDCRRAHNGLSQIVTHEMKGDLLSGDIFVFVSRDRKTAKCLFWNSVGLCLVHQRMEKARVMSFDGLPAIREVTAHDFTMILGGAKVTLTVSIKPPD
jgi:hypothetical protein